MLGVYDHWRDYQRTRSVAMRAELPHWRCSWQQHTPLLQVTRQRDHGEAESKPRAK
jgi:hypothetical protein